MSHTLYLKDGSWLDVGVFLASVWALGWVVVTLISKSKAGRWKVFHHNALR